MTNKNQFVLNCGCCLAACVLMLSGCGGAIRRVRAHLAAGELNQALAAAGTDERALREVALDVLVRALDESETRERAFRGIEASRWQATGRLEELVEGDDQVVGARAAAQLYRLGHKRRNRAKVEASLAAELGEARAAAAKALAPDRAERSFFELLVQDTDSRARLAVASALAGRRDLVFAPELLAEMAFRDPEDRVRAAALRGLARVDPGETLVEACRQSLDAETDPPMRQAAIAALAHAHDRETARALLLGLLAVDDRTERIRAAQVLASWGMAEGRQVIQHGLAHPSVSVAGTAAIAAGQVGEIMVEALEGALDAREEPDVRRHVATALLRFQSTRARAIEVLTELVQQSGPIGVHAAVALAQHTPESAFARLESALDEEDPSTRALAAGACWRFEDGAMSLGARALGDRDQRVRVAAATGLLQALR